ncbi:MAG: hypothetical protein ABIZ36_00270 [Gemmatimonadaceae bacterium]
MMTRRVLLLLFSLGCVAGCASAPVNAPSPSPAPEGTSEPVGPVAGNNKSRRVWRITPTVEVASYQSTLKTTTAERDTPGSRQNSVTTTTNYSLKLVKASNSVRISGNVSAFQIKSDEVAQSLSSNLFVLPFGFDGMILDHNISLHLSSPNQLASLTQCNDSSQTILSIINRDLIVVPQELVTDQIWQDSTSSSLCSGSLPVVVSVIRNYRITGETIINGVPALKIERTEKLVTSGEGSQGQHQITINGTGTGKAQVYIDQISGLLLSLDGTTQIELSIKSSGRIQHFSQTSEEKVTPTSSP